MVGNPTGVAPNRMQAWKTVEGSRLQSNAGLPGMSWLSKLLPYSAGLQMAILAGAVALIGGAVYMYRR